MMQTARLVLASHNAGKLAELRALLAPAGIEVLAQSQFGIGEIEETGATFVENALLKARHASRISALPALADDSGLCVDALGGAPGLHSARYAGADGDARANFLKLLDALAAVPDAHRGAHFHCTLALLRHPEDPAPLLCEGRWRGRILHEPQGEGGFGYDPVFLDETLGQSAAELGREEKSAVSHRGQALRQLLAALAHQPL
ncbi:MAG TPA: RdgB/HAM1 family non-canonical purine NTP pyrophosphatase [Chiayiivirga sp.]|nr:RdgB/HAM1 family non-canonical purine NTP pyrophosphatase [Chiayiivirga sp.]